MELAAFPYPFSLDVITLYTLIPVQDAIQSTVSLLDELNFNYHNLDSQDVAQLLQVVLCNNYFRFRERTFLQIKGLAMGSNISPVVAILFMHRLESQVIRSSTVIGFYKRYIDDIFILTVNKETAESIHTTMNAQHPSIKFEIELPKSERTLSLLDVEVTVLPNEVQTQHYKKQTKKDIFFHFDSALPMNMKRNVVTNEWKRI